MLSISGHSVADYAAYWVLFWSVVNIALPPREVFANCSAVTKRRYNTLLMLIAYYGSLNLRQVSVKLYSAVGETPTDPKEAQGFSKGIEAAKDAVADIPKAP
jgi:hypothetical protein